MLQKKNSFSSIFKIAFPLLFLLCITGFAINIIHPSKKDIQAALHLTGLSFSPSEIDSLQEGIEENLEDFKTMRKVEIPNRIPPALYFNPLPQGYSRPAGDVKPIFTIPNNVPLPQNIDELAWYTIPQLASLIQDQKISSIELTKFFLDRLKKYDEQLHFVISYTEERAMKKAAQADREIANGNYRGPLHGIPYGAKDLIAVAGYKTTWGAAPYKDQVIDMDATVIQKLDEAGAVLVAKLTLGALAWGDVWFGEKTRNPWDRTRGSSGSSAGPGSAVAAGCLPFALGTETLGSIVSPSTVCGTTGLRPTYGTVSKHGAMALSWSMDKIGPMTRSAEDCAIVFDAIRGSDQKDHGVVDVPFGYKTEQDIRNLKVGYVKNLESGGYGFYKNDSSIIATMKKAGLNLVPIELPEYPPITFILNAEAAAAFDDLTRSNKDDLLVRQIKNAWPNSFRTARFIPAVEYIKANRLRSILIEEMHQLMQEVDVYIHPSWSSSSLRITNMTGHPCVVLPNGLLNGRPTSISITGQLYGEANILSLASFIQSITEFDEMHPTLEY